MQDSLTIRLNTYQSEPSFRDLCHAVVGVHAARIQSPFPAWLARHGSARPTDFARHTGLNAKQALLRIRSVRGTLHFYHLDDARHFHRATLAKRIAVCDSLSKGMDRLKIEWFQDAILEFLREKGGSPQYIEDNFENSLYIKNKDDLLHHRMALKYLWERGELILRNTDQSWNGEKRFFEIPESDLSIVFNKGSDEDHSIYMILSRYLESYGPATLKDIQWWSGLSKRDILYSLENLKSNGEITEVMIGAVTLYDTLFSRNLREFDPDDVRFFGWEEGVFKAYYETRFRYISKKYSAMAFNKIGEIKRTIFFRSQIVGIWDVDAAGNPARYELFSPLDKEDIRKIDLAFCEYKNKYGVLI